MKTWPGSRGLDWGGICSEPKVNGDGMNWGIGGKIVELTYEKG